MVIMFKMTPEKREKMIKKLDKMADYIDEFKSCLEESDDYDEEDFEEEPSYRSSMRGGSSASMRGRYGYRRSMR